MFLRTDWRFMVKDKKIGVSHFVYVCIIALLIITCILAIAFGGNKDAGNQMNVMATGISVVLAVIAILMTLVDVAGQRQSIIDIKETAEKLAESQSVSHETIQKTIETLDELVNFRKELMNSVSDYRNGTEELIHELLKKEEKTINKEELQELLSKFNKKTSDLESKVQKIAPNEIDAYNVDGLLQEQYLYKFKQWMINKYPNESKIDKVQVYNEIRLNFSNTAAAIIINYLESISSVFNLYTGESESLSYIDLEDLEKIKEPIRPRGIFRPII